MNFKDPLELPLGYSYNLNSITKVDVTDEFLSMEENARQCHYRKTYGDCLTDKYLNKLKENCKCLPFKLGFEKKV